MKLAEAISKGVQKVTRDFTREKKKAYRRNEDRVSQWQLDRWEQQDQDKQLKAAAYKVMERCYRNVSDNGRLPANKRQMYYAVRPLVLEATGKTWKNSATFTQSVLRDFMNDNPELTADWDIVADARGHFTEPHVKQQIGIGTLEVRSYTQSWREKPNKSDLVIEIDDVFPTDGPSNRYNFALFIEKEGFDPLLQRAEIAERFDLAIFSSKGQTNVATRQLVERLSADGVTILVAHDFDVAGLSIAHWLSHSNETFEFGYEPDVIDLGLRLRDVQEMGLQSEEQIHKQSKDPTDKFWDWVCDLTDDELDFLRGRKCYRSWEGRRVELNAMTSAQFIKWLEKKLVAAGVKKVIPDKETLELAFKRAQKIARARDLIDEIENDDEPPPTNLKKQLAAYLSCRTGFAIYCDKAARFVPPANASD
jgi:DNA topoisomerase VI subunit A